MKDGNDSNNYDGTEESSGQSDQSPSNGKTRDSGSDNESNDKVESKPTNTLPFSQIKDLDDP